MVRSKSLRNRLLVLKRFQTVPNSFRTRELGQVWSVLKFALLLAQRGRGGAPRQNRFALGRLPMWARVCDVCEIKNEIESAGHIKVRVQPLNLSEAASYIKL